MELADKKVAIVVSNYFEEAEFTGPLAALKERGVQVTVIGSDKTALQALAHAEKAGTYQADILLDDADPALFDALVLPGGAMNADKLRMNERLHAWIAEYIEQQKPIAAICHAPWALVSAGVVHGRTLTSYYTIQDDIRNAGASWVDRDVVTDGTIITSRKPDDVPAFNEALLAALAAKNT